MGTNTILDCCLIVDCINVTCIVCIGHLAPLWPALGVVAELIVLALIIVLCDRSSKKR